MTNENTNQANLESQFSEEQAPAQEEQSSQQEEQTSPQDEQSSQQEEEQASAQEEQSSQQEEQAPAQEEQSSQQEEQSSWQEKQSSSQEEQSSSQEEQSSSQEETPVVDAITEAETQENDSTVGDSTELTELKAPRGYKIFSKIFAVEKAGNKFALSLIKQKIPTEEIIDYIRSVRYAVMEYKDGQWIKLVEETPICAPIGFTVFRDLYAVENVARGFLTSLEKARAPVADLIENLQDAKFKVMEFLEDENKWIEHKAIKCVLV